MSLFRTLFSSSGDGVDVKDLPGLLAMQAYCAVWGILIVAMWWVYCNVQGLGLFGLNLGIILCLAAVILVAMSGLFFHGNEQALRWLLHLCSGLCVLCTAVFIWGSGGAHSPFVVFYVMIITLTLKYARNRKAPWVLPTLFCLILFGAFYAWRVCPAIGNFNKDVLPGDGFYWFAVGGGLASIIIAATSSFFEKLPDRFKFL